MGLERLRPDASTSRRGPARRSLCLRYVHGQAAGEAQSANGRRGAALLRNRCPLRACAAAQLAPVQMIDTAFQRLVGCLTMALNVSSVRYLTQLPG